MFHHATCPQADEAPENDPDPEFDRMMDLLDAEIDASQGYAVPVDDSMDVCW